MTRILYPDFKKIEAKCRKKIRVKFPKYGNSWVTVFPSNDWWNKRLAGEIDEIVKAESAFEKENEIIDAINILMFMYESNHRLVSEESKIYQRTWRYNN